MKYTKEERLEIGRRIYVGEITKYQAAEEYGVSSTTARDYMRFYRDTHQLPAKKKSRIQYAVPQRREAPAGLDELEAMTKEELIRELVKARVAEARLKKGYEVKGGGTVIRYVNKNTK